MSRMVLAAIGLVCLAIIELAAAAPTDHFVTTWKTDNPGTTNSTSITVPMIGGPYDIDWNNDGVFDETGQYGRVTHDYGTVGIYTIRIHGVYESIHIDDGWDNYKILSVDQWGTSLWKSMSSAFWGAGNLQILANDTPDFSAVMDMSQMFADATSVDLDTSDWNVTSLTDATDMFSGVTLSTTNYEKLLVGWNAKALKSGVPFNGGNSTYCSPAAAAARANMIASDSWVITDGGQYCPPEETCNVVTASNTTEYFNGNWEACETLILGPNFIVANGAYMFASSGLEINFLPGFTVEQGAILNANVCGQSLCSTSPEPMPYECHSCVFIICETEPYCCELEFDQGCLDKVSSFCGLECK